MPTVRSISLPRDNVNQKTVQYENYSINISSNYPEMEDHFRSDKAGRTCHVPKWDRNITRELSEPVPFWVLSDVWPAVSVPSTCRTPGDRKKGKTDQSKLN